MNQSKNHLPALEIDVAAWRRDIQTFVDMTVDELNSINDQLATGFSAAPNRPRRRPSVADLERPAAAAESPTRQGGSPGSRPHQSRTDERLIQLKRKLELRLSATNGAK